MDTVWHVAQTYGGLILLGGGLAFLVLAMRQGGMSCCRLPQPRGADERPGAASVTGCHEAPATNGAPGVPTASELQAQLVALRAHQQELARQLAAVEAGPALSALDAHDAAGPGRAGTGKHER